jgi:signal peptidase I
LAEPAPEWSPIPETAPLTPRWTPGGTTGDAGATDDPFDIPDSRRPGVERQLRTLLEWVAVAVGALAVALLIKAFLLQAFYIPSGSMEETLREGDRVLVNKLSYRFGDVGRGDVVVFEKPPGASGDINDLIKRVIALPGETVTLVDGDVFIDGNRLEEADYLELESGTFPLNAIPNCDNEPVNNRCTVPDDTVFVMGDNRGGSTDSRRFGPIEQDTIVGRAFLKVWPPGDIGFL